MNRAAAGAVLAAVLLAACINIEIIGEDCDRVMLEIKAFGVSRLECGKTEAVGSPRSDPSEPPLPVTPPE